MTIAEIVVVSILNLLINIGAKDSQKIKIKKKTKTPRITDEGWNSQKTAV